MPHNHPVVRKQITDTLALSNELAGVLASRFPPFNADGTVAGEHIRAGILALATSAVVLYQGARAEGIITEGFTLDDLFTAAEGAAGLCADRLDAQDRFIRSTH